MNFGGTKISYSIRKNYDDFFSILIYPSIMHEDLASNLQECVQNLL